MLYLKIVCEFCPLHNDVTVDCFPRKTDEGPEGGTVFVLGFLHTSWHVPTFPSDVGPSVNSLVILSGWGKEERTALGHQERGESEEAGEVTEGAVKSLHLPCWPLHQ